MESLFQLADPPLKRKGIIFVNCLTLLMGIDRLGFSFGLSELWMRTDPGIFCLNGASADFFGLRLQFFVYFTMKLHCALLATFSLA